MIVEALLKFGYGLYVVTSRDGDRLNGQIANSVFQLTPEPPVLAASINKKNLTHGLIEKSKSFGVNVLTTEADMKLIGRFGFRSGRDVDKFEGLEYRPAPGGNPILTEKNAAFVEVEVTDEVDVGTHTLFIGRVTHGEVLSEDEPMSYFFYRIIKGGGTPETAATYYKAKSKDKA